MSLKSSVDSFTSGNFSSRQLIADRMSKLQDELDALKNGKLDSERIERITKLAETLFDLLYHDCSQDHRLKICTKGIDRKKITQQIQSTYNSKKSLGSTGLKFLGDLADALGKAAPALPTSMLAAISGHTIISNSNGLSLAQNIELAVKKIQSVTGTATGIGNAAGGLNNYARDSELKLRDQYNEDNNSLRGQSDTLKQQVQAIQEDQNALRRRKEAADAGKDNVIKTLTSAA